MKSAELEARHYLSHQRLPRAGYFARHYPVVPRGYYDVALRDFGLMLAALTLGRLASKYDASHNCSSLR